MKRHDTTRHLFFPSTAWLLVLAAMSATAMAGTINWTGGSGDWNVGTNWDLAGEPVTGDDVNLVQSDATDRVVNYVTTLSPTPELASLRIDATGSGGMTLQQGQDDLKVSGPAGQAEAIVGVEGTGTYTQSGGSSQFDRMRIGLTGTGAGDVALTGGSTTIADLRVAFDAGSVGTLDVSGAGDLTVTGAADIGQSGSGVLTQSGGTSQFNELVIGLTSDGTGSADLSGGSMTAAQLILAKDETSDGGMTLSADGSLTVTGNTTVGQGGTGVFTQTGGSSDFEGDVDVGLTSTGVGTFHLVDGEATMIRLRAGLDVGSTGTVEVSGGTLTVANNLSLGTGDASSFGRYSMDGGELRVGNQLQVGSVGDGSMEQTLGDVSAGSVLLGGTDAEGTLLIDGGTLSADLSINVGNGLRGIGTVTQNGGTVTAGGYLDIGVSADSRGLYELNAGELNVGDQVSRVGNTGAGEFRHSGGTHAVANVLSLAEQSASEGTYRLSGSGVVSSHDQYLGGLGVALFEQTGGDNSVGRDMYVGLNAGGEGTYELVDGTVAVQGNAYIGHRGQGLFQQSGGTHTVTGKLELGRTASGRGTYRLDGGGLQAGNADVGTTGLGTFTQYDGTHRVLGSLTIGDGDTTADVDSYALGGGSLHANLLLNKESFDYQGGSLNTGVFVNTGEFEASGPGERRVGGLVVNAGRFKVTDTTIRFDSLFINAGVYESDPSTNVFTDLQVDPDGYLVAGPGDEFVVSGDFINLSTQDLAWATGDATLRFTGPGRHEMYLPAGTDGTAFEWGLLDLTGVTLTLRDGNTGNTGTAFYVDAVVGALLDDGLFTNIVNRTGEDLLSLYFNPVNPLNQYLVDAGYTDGVVMLAPAPSSTPASTPSVLMLMGVGLALLLASRSMRRHPGGERKPEDRN